MTLLDNDTLSGGTRLNPRQAERRTRAKRLITTPSFVVGTAILLLWTVMAVIAQWVAPYNPDETGAGPALAAPSAAHWLGTDDLGRDVLSRVLAGAQDVLTIAPPATALAVCGGVAIGLVAGYYRGVADMILMRSVDLLIAFPFTILAILIVSALGPSRLTLVLMIAVLFAPLIARTVRSATIQVREKDYLAAARLRGERALHIMLVEILPNVLPTIVVEATVRLGYAVFTAATLAFLGLSLQPPAPDWGLTIYTERIYIQTAPWTVLAPAVALASLVVAINLVADGLRAELDHR